jgi:putative restriction endonuclease
MAAWHSSSAIGMALDPDDAVRSAAFAFLADQQRLHGEWWPPVLPRDVLAAGLTLDGRRVPLLGPQGIFKPAILPTIPLSITTAPPKLGRAALYDDAFGYGHLIYRYRGTDARHPDNVGLRMAMSQGKPLVYFHGIIPGQYLAVWPVYVTADVPTDLAFQVAFDPGDLINLPDFVVEDEERRSYALRLVRQRLHQVGFRERVLAAYRRTCAVCRLRHVELLDAAHIIPDGRPRGEPVVPNGLALCKLHHAAFDNNIIGIRPDLGIEVRSDVLAEIDGPMLLHGIQGIQGSRIWTPRSAALRPTAERLEERYAEFRRAS